ncbi:4-hydroxy-tetrahydrodipicolinate reductase [secondary endosymbiont of Trabutina mannipara]|nr:4-hydroxy-tetrahydrodipicolinate reductase [secondary endosymbiont of Trabutina mannipara]
MSNKPTRIAVSGVSGKMGRKLIQAVVQSEQVVLGAALSRNCSELYGMDVGKITNMGILGVKIKSDINEIKEDFDIFIDFTRPDTSLTYLDFCRSYQKGIVIGTTGFSHTQKKIINLAAQDTSIVFAANFSVGINLMLKLLEKAAKVIGNDADIEIIEMHHRNKIDAPSGTALVIGETLAGALGRDLDSVAVYCREKNTVEQKEKSIGFSTIRAGDIVGEHTAIFASIGERLEITHKASSRMTFASGAVRAAVWLSSQKKGIFDMTHVLNIK